MGRHYSHLTKDERQTIFKLLERKVPVTQIAEIVGRHVSTLYRELRRNFFTTKNTRSGPAGFR